MVATFLQFLDSLCGFPTGFDVVADAVEQWLVAKAQISNIKIIYGDRF